MPSKDSLSLPLEPYFLENELLSGQSDFFKSEIAIFHRGAQGVISQICGSKDLCMGRAKCTKENSSF